MFFFVIIWLDDKKSLFLQKIRNVMAKEYNIKIPATKEERVNRFRALVARTMRIKKEMHAYFETNGTTVGYNPKLAGDDTL